MSSPRGCFKTGCFGCLGLIALILLVTGMTALLAWNDAKDSDPRDEVLTPLAADDSILLDGHFGRVVLILAQGDFRVHPAQPGEGLRVEAEYDGEQYELKQDYATHPDSTWQFQLEFRRTGSGMRSVLQSIFSKGPSARIHVYLPPDAPIDLILKVSKGGAEVDLGGLWLTNASINFHQGGGELEFSESLKEPMSKLNIRSKMGGGSFTGLGNASPKVLDISCTMGGGEVDLSGQWLNDCDVSIKAKMGGVAVIIPQDLKVLRAGEDAQELAPANPEVPQPVLRLHTEVQYGEIEVIR